MNEEIEYAEMLEIPVSTVNVVKKRRWRRQKPSDLSSPASHVEPIKDSVIAQVNDKVRENSIETIGEENGILSENANGGSIDFDIPERIDTVRVYSAERKFPFWRKRTTGLSAQDFALKDGENEENGENGESEDFTIPEESSASRKIRMALNAEFIATCALCGAIFLTNVFMPTSAINTFFRSLHGERASAGDTRKYTEFTLSPVVSELSDIELTLSPTGIVTFTGEGCVYPVADGKVSAVIRQADGKYQIKISHSDLFTGMIDGLDYVYYEVGDIVKGNVPVGYSEGENAVQVTMYDDGTLLNCFFLTEENCLAWSTQN